MSKILVIGIGGAGKETVKHMKDTGIPEADYITFGNFENDERKDIPHYNLITMNGFDGLSPSRDPNRSKRLAENVEDDIRKFWNIILMNLITKIDEKHKRNTCFFR